MYAEYVGFVAIFLMCLYAYGVLYKKPVVNVLASILFLVLGLYVLAGGIQFQSGQTTVKTSVAECADLCGLGANSTMTNTTETMTYDYTDMTSPTDSVIPIKIVLGFFMIFLALLGIYMNALD